jgi:hypothetical protein
MPGRGAARFNIPHSNLAIKTENLRKIVIWVDDATATEASQRFHRRPSSNQQKKYKNDKFPPKKCSQILMKSFADRNEGETSRRFWGVKWLSWCLNDSSTFFYFSRQKFVLF